MPIIETDTGTLFFRMRRSGAVDAFSGLTDLGTPFQFDDFETQFGGQSANSSDFRVRNGNSFVGYTDGFKENTWYCVWLVTNNLDNSYTAHLSGGQFSSITQLSAEGISTFGFRNGGNDPLNTFFARNGVDEGILYLDDIFIDTQQNNLSIPNQACPTTDETELQNPTIGWQSVDNFDALGLGGIVNKNGWQASGNITVVEDPDNSIDKVLRVDSGNSSAYKTLPESIIDTEIGTLFFRIRRHGLIDSFGGLSDIASPSSFNDFETQLGGQSITLDDFQIRNGDNFVGHPNGFKDETWYCIWLITNNLENNYTAHIEGGQYNTQTQLSAEGLSTFSFRNGGHSSLTTFFARSGVDDGIFFIDDIFIDAGQSNLSKPNHNCPATDVTKPNIPDSDYTVSINKGRLFTRRSEIMVHLTAPASTTHVKISNDGGFVGSEWQTYSETMAWEINSFLNFLLPRVVYVRFKDEDSSTSGVYSDDIILDVLAPWGTGKAVQTSNNLKLSLDVEDDVSGLDQFRLSSEDTFSKSDWQPFAKDTELTSASLKDILFLQLSDKAGNISSPIKITILSDKLYLPFVIERDNNQ